MNNRPIHNLGYKRQMERSLMKSDFDSVIMCETPTIPTAKKYREVQFSTTKKRSGKESTPFLGLEAGTHRVKFYNDKREVVLTVKTWLSPYGWAWMIVGT